MANRTYYRYELKDGRKVVYYGITNNPQRRLSEHQADGKKFSTLNIKGPIVTKETAEEWEKNIIKTFAKNHSGKSPKYNA